MRIVRDSSELDTAIPSAQREAERAFGRKAGTRVPPRTPWSEQRSAIAAGLRNGAPGGTWPTRYMINRATWHVLDHAWEIEDKSSWPGRAGRP